MGCAASGDRRTHAVAAAPRDAAPLPTPAEASSAAQVPAAPTEVPGSGVFITFANACEFRVGLWWAPEGRDEVEYAVLAPGERCEQHTYTGHRWVTRRESGGVLSTYTAGAAPARVEVRADGLEVADGRMPQFEPCGLAYVAVDAAALVTAVTTGEGLLPVRQFARGSVGEQAWPRVMVEAAVCDVTASDAAGAVHAADVRAFFTALAEDLAEMQRVFQMAHCGASLLARTTIYVNHNYRYRVVEEDAAYAGFGQDLSQLGFMYVNWDAAWLARHGNLPEKLGCIEITSMARYMAVRPVQPAQLLHEVAHVYHWWMHRRAEKGAAGGGVPEDVAAFDAAYPPGEQLQAITAAYTRAREMEVYRTTTHINGGAMRHYALKNEREYFAECSEAFFSTNTFRNDFHPFTRDQLRRADPDGFAMLQRVWGAPGPYPSCADVVPRDVSSAITFRNTLAAPVTVLWCPDGGEEKLYRTLAPGAAYTQSTYAGHRWCVRSGDGRALLSCTGFAGTAAYDISA
eukprot:TRINITY_DN9622_c1_g1_i1.p1 TRINITY_DN9622_c1_g1~~TRINITY_DN9622_c1_g1_i1.p1  ORF type:complete len:515 (+),score=145.70 TRINITY_DN9622_c1_g1_i1:85-1629(+)